MENEILRDIENYENLYQISNLGRVYSLISGKFLKPQKDKDNYRQVVLCKNGKKKTYKIHRLVASAFIPNPLHLPQVNHKDENKTNNRVSNLEWMSHKENMNYGTRTERMMRHPNWRASIEKCLKAAHEKLSKSVLQFDKQGEFVNEYPSTWEAARQTKINQGDISQCCLGKRKSAGKYVWKYKEEAA